MRSTLPRSAPALSVGSVLPGCYRDGLLYSETQSLALIIVNYPGNPKVLIIASGSSGLADSSSPNAIVANCEQLTRAKIADLIMSLPTVARTVSPHRKGIGDSERRMACCFCRHPFSRAPKGYRQIQVSFQAALSLPCEHQDDSLDNHVDMNHHLGSTRDRKPR